MEEYNSLIILKNYGKINIKLDKLLKQKNITRNKLKTLTGIKYETIDRYYKAENIERIDTDFLAKVCFVLNCKIEDILEYNNN